ncbi:hypothetical protein [Marilutibacter aestuarii]|uniref:Uncharacterized protein n=1 Tax=Marilutibacter aestuarii TaxID=1706195 RepID=A0A508AG78_9GAMM|nr:hypothetical protein [Lysobacter aestuarii]TQD47611.1 hypothetical protein FKV25_05840 [Lysobacter aestuarii]
MKHAISILAVCVALAACKPASDGDGAQPVVDNAPAEPTPAQATTDTPLPPAEAPVRGPAFDKTLELQGIGFHVQGGDGQVTVTPTGLEASNEPMTRDIDGQVKDAELADLDADGSPEVYVFVTPASEGAPAGLVAFAANKRKSLSDIYLAPLADDQDAADGYKGGDEIAVVENRLIRRFPLVGEDGQPTGKTRQVVYRLMPGEAGWVLEKERISEF